MTAIPIGTRVRIERDETRYPSRGTWPRFRGRFGTVVEINPDHKRPDRTEYAVVFGKVRKPNKDGSIANGDSVWFQAHELTTMADAAAVRPADGRTAVAGIEGTRSDFGLAR